MAIVASEGNAVCQNIQVSNDIETLSVEKDRQDSSLSTGQEINNDYVSSWNGLQTEVEAPTLIEARQVGLAISIASTMLDIRVNVNKFVQGTIKKDMEVSKNYDVQKRGYANNS